MTTSGALPRRCAYCADPIELEEIKTMVGHFILHKSCAEEVSARFANGQAVSLVHWDVKDEI